MPDISQETMADSLSPAGFARQDVRNALRDIAPLTIALMPIGLIFGTLAAGKGLSVFEIFLMSTLVFAGSSQFAAVELWGYPIPVFAIFFSTLLINARHLLLGVSLAPKLAMRGWQKYLAVFFMSDEIWAVAEKQAQRRPVSAFYWFTVVAVFPTTWVLTSVIGALVGPLLGPPERFGADFAFTAVFVALIASFERSRVMLVTVATAGSVAGLVYYLFGSPWHIMLGACSGIAAAYICADGEGDRNVS